MAYALRYRFAFDGVNGSEYTIDILQKDYRGAYDVRALGRAPVLKREKSGCIYGSSLELYAECQIDGEFAELYTSYADEFKVEVYKDGAVIWTGFVVPELYSEPDIAPPYDVQIIATDGLGELKNHDFVPASELVTIADYITSILSHTNQQLGVTYLSGMRQDSTNSSWEDSYISLAHMEGDSGYDVLQSILESFHASIMLQGDGWLVWRETDMMFMRHQVQSAEFGSAKTTSWWPVGQLSTSIMPANKEFTLTSENTYKENALKNARYETDAPYDEEVGAYVLGYQADILSRELEFEAEVGYRLSASIKAQALSPLDAETSIGVMIEVDAEGDASVGSGHFWLKESEQGELEWSTDEAYVVRALNATSPTRGASAAQTVDVDIPLYEYHSQTYFKATYVKVTVVRIMPRYDVRVYDVMLAKADQVKGYKSVVKIGNNARDKASEVELAIADSDRLPSAAEVFMDGLALNSRWIPVSTWRSSRISDMGYLAFMSRDYALSHALPRMRVQGVLNVPSSAGAMPELFFRDETYYWLESYSYDLRNDEVSVNMLSLPTATIEVDDEVVTEMAETTAARQPSSSSSGGSSGGGGSQGITNVMIDVGALRRYNGTEMTTALMESLTGLTVVIADKMPQGAYNKVIDNSDDYPAVWDYTAEKLTTSSITLYFRRRNGLDTEEVCMLNYDSGRWNIDMGTF